MHNCNFVRHFFFLIGMMVLCVSTGCEAPSTTVITDTATTDTATTDTATTDTATTDTATGDTTSGDSATIDTTPGDTSSATDDSDSSSGLQGPIDFIIQNNTTGPRYINISYDDHMVIHSTDINNNIVQLLDPSCEAACSDAELHPEYCNVMCDIFEGAYVLDAGEWIRFSWDGKLKTTGTTTCVNDGICYERVPLAAGEFKIGVVTYSQYECPENKVCEFYEQMKFIHEASVVGEGILSETTFSVGTTEDVTIFITQ